MRFGNMKEARNDKRKLKIVGKFDSTKQIHGNYEPMQESIRQAMIGKPIFPKSVSHIGHDENGMIETAQLSDEPVVYAGNEKDRQELRGCFYGNERNF